MYNQKQLHCTEKKRDLHMRHRIRSTIYLHFNFNAASRNLITKAQWLKTKTTATAGQHRS